MMGDLTMNGYTINMRQDKRTGEYQAFIPTAYRNRFGERYFMAYTMMDGWLEVSPKYATRCTRPVSVFPHVLKRAVDHNLGYLLAVVPRLSGK